MQETELKITDIFRVMNYHIDSGRKHIYYVMCYVKLVLCRTCIM